MYRKVRWIAAFAVPIFIGLAGCSEKNKQTTSPGAAPHEPDRVASVNDDPGHNYNKYDYVETTLGARPAPKPVVEAPPPKAETKQQPTPPKDNMVRASAAYPTGDRSTSAILVEKIAPAEVQVGQPFDYEIRITNLTNGGLDNVVFIDEYAPDFRVTKSTPRADDTDPMRWAIGSLAAKESKSIVVTGIAGSPGTISSCGSATFSNALCLTVGVVQPALRLTKSATPEALACDTIVLKYVVTNNGTGTARNVRVSDRLPSGLTTADGKSSVELDAGTLGAGQSRDFSINAKAAKSGTYGSAARATADGGLVAESSDSSTVVSKPALTITAECPGTIMIGREATVRFTVKNTGDGPANNTVITAPVPSATTLSSADTNGAVQAGKMTWNLGTLRAGESRSVAMTLRSKGAGAIPTSATVTAACADPATDQCETGVQGVADIGTGVDDADGVVLVGDQHTFTYTVVNQGQIDLTGVKVSCEFSEGLDYASTNLAKAPTVSGKTAEFDVGTLKAGESRSFTIVVKGTKAGEQGVATTTRSNELKRTVRNDEQVTFVDR